MDTAIHAPRNRTPLFALLIANGISVAGGQFTTLSVPWFVLQTTGSATKTGIAGFVTALSFIAAFFGGTVVDRLGSKRVSVGADLASGIAVALVPLLYHTIGLSFGQLLILIFLRAFCNTPGGTARMGLLPDLIALADIHTERANGIYQSIQYGATLAATTSVGVLIALIGATNMLWLDGVSFLFSATVVFFAVPTLRPNVRQQAAASRLGFRTELTQGLRWLIHDRLLSTTSFVATLINLVGTALVAVVLPVFAKDVYGTSVAFGLLFTGFSVGTLSGSLVFAAVGARLPRRPTFIVGILMLGIPLVLLATRPPIWLSIAALVTIGLFNAPLNALFAVIEQERIPVDLRGRVMGAIIALANVAAPIGALLGGYAISSIGLRASTLVIATMLIGVAVWAFFLRALRLMEEQ